MKTAKKVLITGASGLIGHRLTQTLLAKGYEVAHLGRSRKSGAVPTFVWDVKKKFIEEGAFENVTGIVHLAGANVADKRWSPKQKKEILSSRVDSAQLLFDTLSKGGHQVKTLVSASAIGYYGPGDENRIFQESDPSGNDFLAGITHEWEKSADEFVKLGIRVAKVRTGIVLSDKGGALKPMATSVNFLVGSPLGSGQQYMSWIHIDDLVHIFRHLLEEPSTSGAYNAVASNPVTNEVFIKTIARILHKPVMLPKVPAFVLKLALGEMSTIVLDGAKVSNEKIKKSGFKFRFEELTDALKDLLQKG